MNQARVPPASLPFLEHLYRAWIADRGSVPEEWDPLFEAISEGDAFTASLARVPARAALPHDLAGFQDRVDQLVRAYRTRGYSVARIDPLARPPEPSPELDPAYYGFDQEDFARPVSAETVEGVGRITLGELLDRLRETYTRTIGVQYMHVEDPAVRRWLQKRMEGTGNRAFLQPAEMRRILERLAQAVLFEEFVQKKYLGAKTFSLEGSESLIPLLELAIERAGELGVAEIVVGMAHRGRLNVLANIAGKSPRAIFSEFEDREDPRKHEGRGDVKYHLGHSADWTTLSGQRVHVSISFNPSHLGTIAPVVMGRIRAKQDRVGLDGRRRLGFALVLHGDAAFAGEGVVQETLNLSRLEAYETGGALHVIVDNGIGFTTPPEQARSMRHPTDVARMLESPIFHVNGEDPEAVAQVVRLALDFRMEFARDAFIDLHGFRRRGHNESDEPAFTQPVLYRAIRRRKPVWESYLDHLPAQAGVGRAEAEEIRARHRVLLEAELAAAREDGGHEEQKPLAGVWSGFRGGPEPPPEEDPETGVPAERLSALLVGLSRTPPGFRPHPKIARFLEARRRAATGNEPVDWSAAEALALATIALDGHPVRLTGQDSERGTFSHRHAVLHDVEDGRRYVPLEHLDAGQAIVTIRNSPLSEAGVLGFEYGYSLDFPEALVVWEAQFGDFVNAAQVIVDQLLAAAEVKWGRLSGLVLFLPHGFEGQGPEHSSARLERFLSLAAEDNLRIVQPTTPAQLFHLLRRHMKQTWRKPLVVLTPKSLLRHPRSVSRLEDLATGKFQRVLDEGRVEGAPARRVVLCTGKLWFDLASAREEHGVTDVPLVRLEQVYPLPDAVLEATLANVPPGTDVVWAQEEPENMGAWPWLRARFGERLLGRFPFHGVARKESASPATGSYATHLTEQRRLVARAFGEEERWKSK